MIEERTIILKPNNFSVPTQLVEDITYFGFAMQKCYCIILKDGIYTIVVPAIVDPGCIYI